MKQSLKGRGWGSERPSRQGAPGCSWATEARKGCSPQLPGSSASFWRMTYSTCDPVPADKVERSLGRELPWTWWQPTPAQQASWSSADCS